MKRNAVPSEVANIPEPPPLSHRLSPCRRSLVDRNAFVVIRDSTFEHLLRDLRREVPVLERHRCLAHVRLVVHPQPSREWFAERGNPNRPVDIRMMPFQPSTVLAVDELLARPSSRRLR